MTDLDRRFCPRCGTSLVPDMRFCPGCGLETATVGGLPGPTVTDRADQAIETPGAPSDAGAAARPSGERDESDERPAPPSSVRAFPRLFTRGSLGPTMVVSAVIIAAGLAVFGLLMRPQGGGTGSPAGAPQAGQPGTSGGAPAPIVELSIQSPVDRQAIATKDVTVIGMAPPGLSVTRDVSFGLDQHATADGTGHWAMSVGLNNGDNKLVFRIGDDRSTEKILHVTYQPSQ